MKECSLVLQEKILSYVVNSLLGLMMRGYDIVQTHAGSGEGIWHCTNTRWLRWGDMTLYRHTQLQVRGYDIVQTHAGSGEGIWHCTVQSANKWPLVCLYLMCSFVCVCTMCLLRTWPWDRFFNVIAPHLNLRVSVQCHIPSSLDPEDCSRRRIISSLAEPESTPLQLVGLSTENVKIRRL